MSGGHELALDPSTQRSCDGRTVIGGSPVRMLRLSAAGSRVLDGWLAGKPVPVSGPGAGLAGRLIDGGVAHPLWGAPTSAPSAVTVVIPVRDDPAGLTATLGALDGACPIVVVDDGSGDPQPIRAVAEAHGATVIRRERSGGPGVARQHGRARVDNPLIAFVDADCEPEPGWLAGLVGHFADPEVMAVAPRIRSCPGSSVLERYEVDASPLDLGDRPALVRPGALVAYVPTAALIVRADVPTFDPALRYGEDVDLIWRIVAAGGRVRYDPTVTVWHRPRPTWGAWANQRRRYGSSAGALATRHGAAVAPLVVPPSAVAALAVGMARGPVGAVAIAAAAAAAVGVRLRKGGLGSGVALGVVASGQLRLVVAAARATRRVWWPLVAVGLARRGRRAPLLFAVLGPVVVDAWRDRPEVGRARYVVLSVADDLAYGVGVWQGCAAARTIRPLVPSLAGRSALDRGRSLRARLRSARRC